MTEGVFEPNEWLPSGITPFPGAGNLCVEGCGHRVHIYEAGLMVRDDGGIVCGTCARRIRQRAGRDPRQIYRNFFWRHGHDPNDFETTEESPNLYVTLQPTEAPVIDQRSLLHGGPETPFPCEKCGTNLRAAAERTVEEILRPLNYSPAPGKVAPREKIIALVCPNDRPEARHPYLQIRESFLRVAMNQEAVK